jgi:hypothetical protein
MKSAAIWMTSLRGVSKEVFAEVICGARTSADSVAIKPITNVMTSFESDLSSIQLIAI